MTRLHLPITDMGAPTEADFERAVAWREAALAEENAKVYLHCRAGMERTAAIAIAYWAARDGLNYDEALSYLKSKRAIFAPLPSQQRATKAWIAARE